MILSRSNEHGGLTLQSGIGQNLRNIKRKSLVGQVVLLFLGIELLFFSSFVAFKLPTATNHNIQRFIHKTELDFVIRCPEQFQSFLQEKIPVLNTPAQEVRFSQYVTTIPLAVTLGYILGFPFCIISVLGFVVLGLIGPIFGLFSFAAGGGLNYWSEPGFGYLIGMVAGSCFADWINPDERRSWRQVVAGLGGVLITHAVGLSCLLGSSIFILIFEGEKAYVKWQPYLFEQIRNLSWYPLPYDLILAVIFIGISFPLRWLVVTLIAPDIASRHRPRLETQLEVLSETGG